MVYSDHQRLELEKEFHYSRYITIRRKAELASNVGLSERQVRTPAGAKTSKSTHPHFQVQCPNLVLRGRGKNCWRRACFAGIFHSPSLPLTRGRTANDENTHSAAAKETCCCCQDCKHIHLSKSLFLRRWVERKGEGGGCVFLSCRRRFLSVSCTL